MIKNQAIKWAVILVTGAASYGLPYFASQNVEWTQVCSLLNLAIVSACIILTGFPAKAEA